MKPTVSGSFSRCFCWLVQQGERKSCSNNACSLACFVMFLFSCFALLLSSFPYFPSPPALCRYLLPLLYVVSSVQQFSVPLQFVCIVLLVAFLICLHIIFQNSCLSFGFFPLDFIIFFLYLWTGLFCCGLVPGTLAFYLLYLEQLCLVDSVSQPVTT